MNDFDNFLQNDFQDMFQNFTYQTKITTYTHGLEERQINNPIAGKGFIKIETSLQIRKQLNVQLGLPVYVLYTMEDFPLETIINFNSKKYIVKNKSIYQNITDFNTYLLTQYGT